VSRELLRFVFVGIIGFVVDGGGTWMLVKFGVPPIAARVPALLSAIVVTWLLNRSLTFRVTKPRSRAELTRYVAVALSSAAMNFLLYSLLIFLGVHPLIAVAIATLVLLAYSFLAYRRLVFHASR
jgi:putative flippase GtrA